MSSASLATSSEEILFESAMLSNEVEYKKGHSLRIRTIDPFRYSSISLSLGLFRFSGNGHLLGNALGYVHFSTFNLIGPGASVNDAQKRKYHVAPTPFGPSTIRSIALSRFSESANNARIREMSSFLVKSISASESNR